MLRRRQGQGRRGDVLVYFALLVFALMALAAIVVDLGFLRVTQQQMQSATDTGALEGLRFRDDASLVQQANETPDQARRRAASELVAARFEGDLDFHSGNFDPLQVGAGPVLVPVGGVGPSNALQTLLVPQPPFTSVYKPDGVSQVAPGVTSSQLQPNSNNLDQGDMVAGTFNPGMSPDENPDYTRDDFTRSDPTAPAAMQPSFLVRMRRTDDRNDDVNAVSDVSSHGPSLPLLFGRGALITSPDPTQGYAPRVHGLTVRATSIADARRAKSIGAAYPDTLYLGQTPAFPGISGAAPFAFLVSYWTGLSTDTLTANADGSLTSTANANAGSFIGITSLANAVGSTDGTVMVTSAAGFPAAPFTIRIDNELLQVTAVNGLTWTVLRAQQGTGTAANATTHTADAPVTLHAGLTLGPALTALSSPRPDHLDLLVGPSFTVFVPLVDDARGLVAGFGKVTWSVVSWNASGFKLQVTRQSAAVAPQNATAVFTQPLTVTADQLGPLLQAHINIPDSILAPALVR